MELNCAAGDEHPAGDVGVGQALRQQRGHRVLGVGECRPAGLGPLALAVDATPDAVDAQPGVGTGGVPGPTWSSSIWTGCPST
jgi:hypothetical protein